jgi:2-polyprenyl-3-methyl-5-hydroxy-6-metoxy-1,4-benzoquinol methylase
VSESVAAELMFTGERPVPGATADNIFMGVIGRYTLADRLLTRTGARGLEAGCGTGIGSAFLASRGNRVIAVEIDPVSVAWGNEHNPHPNLDLVQGRAEEFAGGEGEFDWVVAFECIEHMDFPQAFIEHVYRVLKPGGKFLCSVPHCLNDVLAEVLYDDSNPYHTQRFTPQSMRHMLNLNFDIREEWGQNFTPLKHYMRLLAHTLVWNTIARLPGGRASIAWRDRRSARLKAVSATSTPSLQTSFEQWHELRISGGNVPAPLAKGPMAAVPETTIFLAEKRG